MGEYGTTIIDHSTLSLSEFVVCIFQSLTPAFWIVWVQRNKDCMLFAVRASMQQMLFLKRAFLLIFF